jgi:hypothetical protein
MLQHLVFRRSNRNCHGRRSASKGNLKWLFDFDQLQCQRDIPSRPRQKIDSQGRFGRRTVVLPWWGERMVLGPRSSARALQIRKRAAVCHFPCRVSMFAPQCPPDTQYFYSRYWRRVFFGRKMRRGGTNDIRPWTVVSERDTV